MPTCISMSCMTLSCNARPVSLLFNVRFNLARLQQSFLQVLKHLAGYIIIYNFVKVYLIRLLNMNPARSLCFKYVYSASVCRTHMVRCLKECYYHLAS